MKRFLSAFVCLGLLFSLCSPIAEAAPQGAGVTTVIACSDFQPDAGNEAGKKAVRDILGAMGRDGITSADGLLFCGDYHAQMYTSDDLTREGLEALKDAVSGVVTTNLVLGKGNHDSGGTAVGMSPSGKNDPASGAYGVFLINENDYMWFNSNEATIRRTAQNLKAYLNEKRAAQFDRPIFVLSHLALNYSMRTYNDGDGKYAHYIFDVLNEAGAAGLNIFFLFGHNHSNGWDDYLGGASIYLSKGDKILISQGNQHDYEEETLQFTYMNAGYVGYYRNVNGTDDALTMTVFQISGNQVTVARYDANGRHVLKSEGVRNNYKNEGSIPKPYMPNATQYASPQTVTLTAVTPPPPVEPEVHEGACYTRVTDFSGLTDGGKYLLMCHTLNDGDGLMLPKKVTKPNASGVTRTGFDVEFWDGLGGDTIYGDYAAKEWTFTNSAGRWIIGDGVKYAGLSDIGSEIQALFLDASNVGIVSMADSGSGSCTFRVGYNAGYAYLNYNSRKLVNGYTSDPAEFYIYGFAGYDVAVVNGTASPAVAAPGEQVSVTAGAAPTGQIFDRWVVVEGGVALSAEDSKSPTITFTMPANGVKLRAVYRSATGPDPVDPVPVPPCSVHSYGGWELIVKATCTEAGMDQRKCLVCGNVDRERIAPLEHEYSSTWTTDVPAAETVVGVRSRHCIRCSARTEITEIPMTMRLPYHDVKEGGGDYAAVQYVVSRKLFKGVSATEFAPDVVMSRAMLATVLWRMDGEPAAGEYNPYSDVAPGKYYTSAVLWAWEDGIFGDTGSSKFMPAGDVTREQVAMILYQYSQEKGYDTSKQADLVSFPDSGSISDFAREALAWAVAEELMMGINQDGVHLLAPQDGATRAQVAAILMRYQKNVVEQQHPVSTNA